MNILSPSSLLLACHSLNNDWFCKSNELKKPALDFNMNTGKLLLDSRIVTLENHVNPELGVSESKFLSKNDHFGENQNALSCVSCKNVSRVCAFTFCNEKSDFHTSANKCCVENPFIAFSPNKINHSLNESNIKENVTIGFTNPSNLLTNCSNPLVSCENIVCDFNYSTCDKCCLNYVPDSTINLFNETSFAVCAGICCRRDDLCCR